MIQLSNRVQQIKSSATLALNARAMELKAQGKDVIALTVGEPNFDTPEHIKQAAIEAMRKGLTKYTAVDGTPSLKEAILRKLKKDNELEYISKQILVSCGAKHSLYNLFQALLNPGDEVIIPAPYWVSYPDMVKLAEAKPIIVEAGIKQHFKLTAEQLEAHITPNTRLLIINSPSNPTGMAYTKAELKQLGDVLNKYTQVNIVTDDIYEYILWTKQPFSNIVNACPTLYDRTIVINGVSKSYAMTGWRIGYAAGPVDLIKAMKKIQSQSTSNPNSIAQAAAEVALDGPKDCVNNMVNDFKERHDFVVKSLNEIDGFHCLPADGAFYAFPDIQAAMRKLRLKTDTEFAEYLINKAGIVLIPGSEFGAPGCIRLSYAVSLETLDKALKRIRQAVLSAKTAV